MDVLETVFIGFCVALALAGVPVWIGWIRDEYWP